MKINSVFRYCAIFLLLILAVIGLNSSHMIKAYHHEYFIEDQDSAMHMVIAEDLLKNNDWDRHTLSRLPADSDTHAWTKVISVLLVAGALFFHCWMPLSQALYLWSFILPMICFAISVGALWWAALVFKPTKYQQWFIVLAALCNPAFKWLFSPLSVDYDFFLVTLSIIYWGCLFRLLQHHQKKWAIATAIVAGVAAWTSVAFMVILFIGVALLLWQCLIKPDHDLLKRLVANFNVFLMVLLIVFSIETYIEHRHFFTVTYDILSIVHIVFFLLLFIGFNVYCMQQKTKNATKIMMVAVMLAVGWCLMNALFPGFYSGPYNQCSADILKYFFPFQMESYSLFYWGKIFSFSFLFYFILGVIYFCYAYINGCLLSQHVRVFCAATIMTALTLYMFRWIEFAVPLNIVFASFFVAQNDNKKISFVLRVLSLMAIVLIPDLLLNLRQEKLSADVQCKQQFDQLLQSGYLDRAEFEQDKTILTHGNFGPFLLYATHHSIIASNDHHNGAALIDSLNFYKENERGAKEMVMKRKVNLILTCPIANPTHFDLNHTKWLQPIAVPKAYPLWRLYRVTEKTVK